MPFNLPISEPTSVMNFSTLVANVAFKMGVASYGSTATGIPQIPSDPHNLFICQNIVNDAIRMMISDAPAPSGWFWGKPVAQIDIWPQIGPDPTGSTYISSTGSTSSTIIFALTTPNVPPSTVQNPATFVPNFVNSMEQRQIWLAGQPSTGTLGWFVAPNQASTIVSTIGLPYTIVNYLSPTSIEVFGAFSTLQNSTITQYNNKIPFAMQATGDYTLPADFSGEVAGEITFIAQTNRGMVLHWTDETTIRQRRQNFNIESGTPYHAAVRIMAQPQYQLLSFTPPFRRWELMTWRVTSEFLSVLFPYVLGFNNLVNNTDLPPSPFSFDECLIAACRAKAEQYLNDSVTGPDFTYYRQTALPNAYKINGRAANKSIGYNGSGLRQLRGMGVTAWRDFYYQRPPVGII